MLTSKIQQFKDIQRTQRALYHMESLLGYDQAVSMPEGADDFAANTTEVINLYQHRLMTDPENIKLVEELINQSDELEFQTRREAEEFSKQQRQLQNVPEEIVSKMSAEIGAAYGAWEKAKSACDYEMFRPNLEALFSLKTEYAEYLDPEKDAYDVLLDEFEPGLTSAMLDELFDSLEKELVPIIRKAAGYCSSTGDEKHYSVSGEKCLTKYIMDYLGIDRTRFAYAESAHPMTADFSRYDVRITSRYSEHDWIYPLYSTIHECGHALYELSVGDSLTYSILGHGASTAMHEAQARLLENNIGRSEAFIHAILPAIMDNLPEAVSGLTEKEIWSTINKINPSVLRSESDEITYPIHIMIRYRIERKLFSGEITLDEAPELWNRLYNEYLGVEVKNDAEGILQDVHWAYGIFGYFPSYVLGNVYSAQIIEAITKEIDVAAKINAGKVEDILGWLEKKVWKHGMLYTPSELMKDICGSEYDPQAYIRYLKNKANMLLG